MSSKSWHEQAVLGIPVLAEPAADVAWVVRQAMTAPTHPFVIVTPNPEQLVLAAQRQSFAEALLSADLRIPDGAGVVWALQRQGVKVQRTPGVEVVSSFLSQFPDKRYALLGSRDFGKKELLVQHVPIAWNEGYTFVGQPSVAEEKAVKVWLMKTQPDVLFVAFGAPAQEEWVNTHQQLLKDAGVKVVMVVGGSFDMLLGKLRRAPNWVRTLNLEWLFRLLQQPSRLGRQLTGAQFFWRVKNG